MSPADIFRKAAGLLQVDAVWCQRVLGTLADGTSATAQQIANGWAPCMCLEGLLIRAACGDGDDFEQALEFLRERLGECPWAWNDKTERTQTEVQFMLEQQADEWERLNGNAA